MIRPEKKLVLENGLEFYGTGFGASATKVCEIVFNTSVVGYQEIISDPSYADQIVVLDGGKVVEIGNHEELVAKCGTYYELVRNQLELGN